MKDFGRSQVIRAGFTQVLEVAKDVIIPIPPPPPPKKFVRPSVCVQIVSGTYRLNALLDVDDTWYSISHRFKKGKVIKVLKALVEAQGHKLS